MPSRYRRSIVKRLWIPSTLLDLSVDFFASWLLFLFPWFSLPLSLVHCVKVARLTFQRFQPRTRGASIVIAFKISFVMMDRRQHRWITKVHTNSAIKCPWRTEKVAPPCLVAAAKVTTKICAWSRWSSPRLLGSFNPGRLTKCHYCSTLLRLHQPSGSSSRLLVLNGKFQAPTPILSNPESCSGSNVLTELGLMTKNVENDRTIIPTSVSRCECVHFVGNGEQRRRGRYPEGKRQRGWWESLRKVALFRSAGKWTVRVVKKVN